LELDSTDLSVKNAMELAENGGGLEQIGTFQVENWQRHLVWRTSDGRIWRRKMSGTEKDDNGMGQILPIGWLLVYFILFFKILEFKELAKIGNFASLNPVPQIWQCLLCFPMRTRLKMKETVN
jgi:hypothetical protein